MQDNSITVYASDGANGSGLYALEVYLGNPDGYGILISTSYHNYDLDHTYELTDLPEGIVYIRSYDQAGNYSQQNLFVDYSTPAIELCDSSGMVIPGGSTAESRQVTIKATDGGAGIQEITLTPEGGSDKTYAYANLASVSRLEELEPKKTYTVKAKDALGHESETTFNTGRFWPSYTLIDWYAFEMDLDYNNNPHFFNGDNGYDSFHVDPYGNEGYITSDGDNIFYFGPDGSGDNMLSVVNEPDEFGTDWAPGVYSFAFNSEGMPGVIYLGIEQLEDAYGNLFDVCTYKFAYWNGTAWTRREVYNLPEDVYGTSGGACALTFSREEDRFIGLFVWKDNVEGSYDTTPEKIFVTKLTPSGSVISNTLIDTVEYQEESESYARVDYLVVASDRYGKAQSMYCVRDYANGSYILRYSPETGSKINIPIDWETYPFITVDGKNGVHIAYEDDYGTRLKKVAGGALIDDDFFPLTDIGNGNGIYGWYPFLMADKDIQPGQAGNIHFAIWDPDHEEEYPYFVCPLEKPAEVYNVASAETPPQAGLTSYNSSISIGLTNAYDAGIIQSVTQAASQGFMCVTGIYDAGIVGPAEGDETSILISYRDNAAENEYAMYSYSGGQWAAVSGQQNDTANNRITAAINSPGLYAVLAELPPPGTPLNLVVVPGDGLVNLNWSAVSGAAGYNIMRAASPFVKINDELVTDTQYVDTTVQNGHEYTYAVLAVDVNGNESPFQDNPAPTVPKGDFLPPGMINDLSVSRVAGSPGSVKLEWTAAGNDGYEGGITGALYEIRISSDIARLYDGSAADITYNKDVVCGERDSYTAGGLLDMTTYYFRVWLTDGWNNRSPGSNVCFSWLDVAIDTMPPRISLDALPQYTNFSTMTISGIYEEENLDIITLNGIPAAIDTDNATFSGVVALSVGANEITASAKDLSGNVGISSGCVILDIEPPVTQIGVGSSELGVNICFNAADDISGVAQTLYRLDSGVWTQYVSTFTLPAGTADIYYYSTDNASNIEAQKNEHFEVSADTVAPVCQLQITGYRVEVDGKTYLNCNSLFEITVFDPSTSVPSSGVKQTQYRVDEGGWQVYSVAFGLTLTDGMHTLHYRAEDNAGNVSAENAFDFFVDTTKPFVVETFPPDGGRFNVKKHPGVRVVFSEPVKCADWEDNVIICEQTGRGRGSGRCCPASFCHPGGQGGGHGNWPHGHKEFDITYSPDDCSILISGRFRNNAKYTITLKDGITDVAGNKLDNYTFSFRTLISAREGCRYEDEETGLVIIALPDTLPCDGWFDVSIIDNVRLPRIKKPFRWLFNGKKAYLILYRDEDDRIVEQEVKRAFRLVVVLKDRWLAFAPGSSSGSRSKPMDIKNVKLYQVGTPSEAARLALHRVPGLSASTVADTGQAYRAFALSSQSADEGAEEVSADVHSFGMFTLAGFAPPDESLGDLSCYPNPFDPLRQNLTIQYYLISTSEVDIAVYDLLGNLVKTWKLPSGGGGGAQTGLNTHLWDGRNGEGRVIASGGYIVYVRADGQSRKFKVLGVK
ncbi:MAG: Ig-like domain-containing protein [Endomicrobiales bacterium]|nr:Ig-like domain-containing protein [Endomicrobiales bacterium]